jgi:hypothetical protein
VEYFVEGDNVKRVFIRDRKWIYDLSGTNSEIVDFFMLDASDVSSIDTSRIGDCSTATVVETGEMAMFINGDWIWMS